MLTAYLKRLEVSPQNEKYLYSESLFKPSNKKNRGTVVLAELFKKTGISVRT